MFISVSQKTKRHLDPSLFSFKSTSFTILQNIQTESTNIIDIIYITEVNNVEKTTGGGFVYTISVHFMD